MGPHVDVLTSSVTEPAANELTQHEDTTLRQYNDETERHVEDLYRKLRQRQTYHHVNKLRKKYSNLSYEMSPWDAVKVMSKFIDVSDPDVSLPQITHLYQTAESIRAAGLPTWFQLVGFIHDLGKCLYLRGCDEEGTSIAEQWSIVGDTFLVGELIPQCTIYPEFNVLNRDHRTCLDLDIAGQDSTQAQAQVQAQEKQDDDDYTPSSDLSCAVSGCGLDNMFCSYGHDEYLYEVLSQNSQQKIPEEGLYAIRYHSLYPWHTGGAYTEYENDKDRGMKPWVLLLNEHDLYTKRNVEYSSTQLQELECYYKGLIDEYLPSTLLW